MRKFSAENKEKLFFDCLAAVLALLVGTPWFFAAANSFARGRVLEAVLWGLGGVVFPILFLVKPDLKWGCAVQVFCVFLALCGPLFIRAVQLPPRVLSAIILIVVLAAAGSALNGWLRRGKD